MIDDRSFPIGKSRSKLSLTTINCVTYKNLKGFDNLFYNFVVAFIVKFCRILTAKKFAMFLTGIE